MYYVHFIISLLYLCARLLLHYCVSIGEWRICLFTENRAYVTTYTENRITTPRRNEILSYFEDPCIDNISKVAVNRLNILCTLYGDKQNASNTGKYTRCVLDLPSYTARLALVKQVDLLGKFA